MDDLDATYRRLFPVLRAKCERMLGNRPEADEIAQETFVRLWRAREREAPIREQLAWAHTTATRLAIDLLRKRRVRATADLPDPGTSEQAHLGRVLEELARGLTDDQLTAILLHRVDGVPQDEIARALGCTARTIRRWLADFDARQEAS